jgi:DNA-damage-inducible protein D
LPGYGELRDFNAGISKAKTACGLSAQLIANHFVDVNKMGDLGPG